jgi:hypothetical protein
MKKLFFVTLLLVCTATAAFAADGSVGIIAYLEGVCDITPEGGQTRFAQEQDPIYVGDRIRTKSHSKTQIIFNDRSVVKLGPSSCIIVEEFKLGRRRRREAARITVTRGKIEAVVSKTGDPDTFVIATPNAEGSVKGSDIFVFYQAGKTGVLVKEGSMAVANTAFPDQAIKVTQGDSVIVPYTQAPGALRPYLDAELKLHRRDVERSLLKKWLPRKGSVTMTGLITSVGGTVRLYKKGALSWNDAQLNDTVTEGDRIQTGDDGRVEIRLDNGNTIYLQANSELAFEELKLDAATKEYANVFKADRGKIKAIVEKHGRQSTFEVKTPQAVCGPRGTVMYLDIDDDETEAFFEGGPGLITSTITGNQMNIAPGYHSSANTQGFITTPTVTSTSQRMNLEQTWPGAPATDGYLQPTGPEGTFQQSLIQPVGEGLPTPDITPEVILAQNILDQLPFDQTTNGGGGSAGPNLIYNNPSLAIGHGSPEFAGATLNVTLYDDGTWIGTIVPVATLAGDVGAPFDIFFNDLSNDVVSVVSGGPSYTRGNPDASWTAVVVPPSHIPVPNTTPQKNLVGSMSGTFYSDDTYDGTASGTWTPGP